MLKETINEYVSMKRAMGFKFKAPNSLLQNFAAFAEARGETHVRCQSVVEWASLAPSMAQKRNRLLTVRRFSIAMKTDDNQYEVLPFDAFGRHASKRRMPHIYTSNELQLLFNAASKLKPKDSIKPRTYSTIFALLATTGLRISEALALNIDDISSDGLVIRCTKFAKDRLVPLHFSAKIAIEHYLVYRSKYNNDDPALFVSNKGMRLPYSTVFNIFLQIMRSIGLRDGPGSVGTCLHDLRHTFAVKSLEQCAGNRVAISRHMVALSTYLGHARISDTYWYLQATPTLLAQISQDQELCYRGDFDD